MRLLTARKWMTLAALACGTSFQLTACRDEAALFGVRTLFSTLFVPVNQLIVFIFQIISTTIPGLGSIFGGMGGS